MNDSVRKYSIRAILRRCFASSHKSFVMAAASAAAAQPAAAQLDRQAVLRVTKMLSSQEQLLSVTLVNKIIYFKYVLGAMLIL